MPLPLISSTSLTVADQASSFYLRFDGTRVQGLLLIEQGQSAARVQELGMELPVFVAPLTLCCKFRLFL